MDTGGTQGGDGDPAGNQHPGNRIWGLGGMPLNHSDGVVRHPQKGRIKEERIVFLAAIQHREQCIRRVFLGSRLAFVWKYNFSSFMRLLFPG